MTNKISIIGAGLTGLLLALFLEKCGYSVDIFEKRNEDTLTSNSPGRRASLDLTTRGLLALQEVSLLESVISNTTTIKGRTVHINKHDPIEQIYFYKKQQHVYTIDRAILFNILLETIKTQTNIKIHFATIVESFDDKHDIVIRNIATDTTSCIESQFIFAADGAFSTTRMFYENKNLLQISESKFNHQYKEISIPQEFVDTVAMNHFHMWVNQEAIFLLHPNYYSKTFGTLILPESSNYSFAKLISSQNISKFVNDYFPSLHSLNNFFVKDILANPINNLYSISCQPWLIDNKVLLIGDAAYAMLPFLGQGVNCNFEDCLVFYNLLQKYNNDLQQATQEYCEIRKKTADAIVYLSEQNYLEQYQGWHDAKTLLHYKLQRLLEKCFPEFVPYQFLVRFSTIPFDKVSLLRDKQIAIIHSLCEQYKTLDNIDWLEASTMINSWLLLLKTYESKTV